MWLKNEGVSLWVAAGFLGLGTDVLVHSYGDWDLLSQCQAVAALTGCARQKAAAVQLRRLGIAA